MEGSLKTLHFLSKFTFGRIIEIICLPVQSCYGFKIAGEGMPIQNTQMFGDQIILIKSIIPDIIDREITDSIIRYKSK